MAVKTAKPISQGETKAMPLAKLVRSSRVMGCLGLAEALALFLDSAEAVIFILHAFLGAVEGDGGVDALKDDALGGVDEFLGDFGPDGDGGNAVGVGAGGEALEYADVGVGVMVEEILADVTKLAIGGVEGVELFGDGLAV